MLQDDIFASRKILIPYNFMFFHSSEICGGGWPYHSCRALVQAVCPHGRRQNVPRRLFNPSIRQASRSIHYKLQFRRLVFGLKWTSGSCQCLRQQLWRSFQRHKKHFQYYCGKQNLFDSKSLGERRWLHDGARVNLKFGFLFIIIVARLWKKKRDFHASQVFWISHPSKFCFNIL